MIDPQLFERYKHFATPRKAIEEARNVLLYTQMLVRPTHPLYAEFNEIIEHLEEILTRKE